VLESMPANLCRGVSSRMNARPLAEASHLPDGDLPSISIVIPARNEEDFVSGALSSVIAQNYPRDRMEAVVVDNGSTDQTSFVAVEFSVAHPEVDVTVAVEPVRGVGRAKNTGASTAAGDVLVFLDADSRMEPNLVYHVACSYLRHHPVASIKVLSDGGTRLERAFFGLMEFGKERFGIRAQMMYCERQLFVILGGFRPDFHVAEDLDFLKRAAGYLKTHGQGAVPHLSSSGIMTSPRRLSRHRYHLGMLGMFARWFLAFLGLGRGRAY
jgi:glycosyltransferase involved in cell wall biosynthesis